MDPSAARPFIPGLERVRDRLNPRPKQAERGPAEDVGPVRTKLEPEEVLPLPEHYNRTQRRRERAIARRAAKKRRAA